MRQRLLARLAPVCLAGILGAAACTDTAETGGNGLDPDRTPSTDLSSDDIVLTSGLQTVDSCDALLERIKDEAIERVGPYGFQSDNYFFEGGIRLEAGDDEEAAESEAQAAPATTTAARADSGLAAADGDDSGALTESGEDFSETNNQEQGVDEADLVKTDGERLVIVSGSTLRVIDTTGRVPELVKTIDLPNDTWGGQLFLRGDRALLMTTGWTDRPFLERSIPVDWYPGSPIGRLIEVDLNSSKVARTFEFEGNYLSAREIDGSIRIVLTASADRFSFVYPSNEGAAESAERANRDLIERSTIDQWIPTYRITEGGETVAEGPIVDCERVHLPAEFAGFGSLVMLTADLDEGLAVNDALSVFTNAQTMYASTDRVAVATPSWPEFGDDGSLIAERPDYETAIHTFDITDPDRAAYVASGAVRGHLLNQYSLSEYDGHLRVATTDGDPWWGGSEESESFVTVLAEDDGALRQVGQVGGLGRGEQIFAVRFLGDLGYVVTFEQVDPLYVIDLRSPTEPRVLGELKIPGFSSYLHPVGDDHLLGIGTDGDDSGRTFGAAISLFDVSDLSNPQLVDKVNFDESVDVIQGSTYSPISHDAKAFTYWDDVALVPVSWWDYDPNRGTEENGSDVVLVAVDAANGELTEIGRVSHPKTMECESGIYVEPVPLDEDVDVDDGDTESGSGDAEASFVDPEPGAEPEPADEAPATSIAPDDEFCWSWAPEVQRTVVIGENLFSISDGGVLVNAFDGLGNVAWIPFNQR